MDPFHGHIGRAFLMNALMALVVIVPLATIQIASRKSAWLWARRERFQVIAWLLAVLVIALWFGPRLGLYSNPRIAH